MFNLGDKGMWFQRIFISFLFSIVLYPAFTQVFHGTHAQEYIADSRTVWIQKETKKVRFIDFKPGNVVDMLQAGESLSAWLHLPEQNTFKFRKEITDQLGNTHFRYQQHYKGIPVEGAVYIIHTKGKNLAGAGGEYFDIAGLNVTPGISGTNALDIAIAAFPSSKYYWEYDRNYFPAPELVLLPIDTSLYQ